jgi:hypothetical protein
MDKIKQYITEKSEVNGFDFYKYLHIKGGSGNWKGKSEKFLNGGEYDYCLFYASPDEMEGLNCCERVWCVQNKIPFGTGKTIEEAYKNYLSKIKP